MEGAEQEVIAFVTRVFKRVPSSRGFDPFM